MKKLLIFLLTLLSLSCTSVYDEIEGNKVKEIRIQRYSNYYESYPVSEVIVTNKREINDILRPLKFLFYWDLESREFKNFTDSKTVIYFILNNHTSKSLHIRNNRLELQNHQFYKRNQLKELRFIEIVSQF